MKYRLNDMHLENSNLNPNRRMVFETFMFPQYLLPSIQDFGELLQDSVTISSFIHIRINMELSGAWSIWPFKAHDVPTTTEITVHFPRKANASTATRNIHCNLVSRGRTGTIKGSSLR
ncbi:hypothetical protein CDAR_316561 [Caerostris darwini]|uniref:Uncharacterized protein n=1 Tax=Caerostris darwini TaxID=1538125 RepID=A0AAV4UJZ4_9ARAC|nr:hypothetical protein CDAR_316561 [Caerostris darwini]